MEGGKESLVGELKEEKKVDISRSRLRFLMLGFACMLCFGSYFIYDNPSALQTQLMDVSVI